MSEIAVPSVNVSLDPTTGVTITGTMVWNPDNLSWERATQGDVGGTGLTDTELRAAPIEVTGGLTDAELRATPVPVSGTVTASGPLTDVQLRAADVKITLDGESVPVTGAFFQATQPVSVAATLTVDGSGVTQPVSGTITANQGTSSENDWRMDLRRGQTILFGVIDTAASGFVQLVAADATRKIKVLSYAFVVGGTTNVYFASAATKLTGAMPFVVNTGIASPVATPAGGHLMETAVNEAFRLNNSAAVQVSGSFSYFLEA